MIITRTPFRVPIGGGGTDVPEFYRKHGGYVFSAAIDKYMYVTVNRPVIDKLIRLKYSVSETVMLLEDLKHELAREALKASGVTHSIEVTSFADLPAGTGMGSSASYLVGLLKALHALRRREIDMHRLAELAAYIELEVLKHPVGKHDQYLASFGGFLELEIDTEGHVEVRRPKIKLETIEVLEHNVRLFYTHKQHKTNDILSDQNKEAAVSGGTVERCLLAIKEIGRQIKSEFEKGNIENFGKMLNEHWSVKKQMSNKISDPEIDRLYDLALGNGAEGGKIMGSGGGGLFLFYVPGDKRKLKEVLEREGLTEMKYRFDHEGSKILLNLFQHPSNY